ncbi:carboxypeptidase-like regulatory domain-containing protein [Hyalangium sp.]|uniref:carboxypeptidase-like regulatory domain-containing protein n=1 Tax=Hyalangium sp. TaxID=2028555 RepID=UPI002D3C58B4|nr:carboxypeptidase-like regulatory domain-containing protein [Hyalangium sp.]HYH95377.1 carboxypeptidase-like regulatory domain-containing protein [Hyalangium sp.]
MNTKQWSLTLLASAVLVLGCSGMDDTEPFSPQDAQVDTSAAVTSAVFSGTVSSEQGVAVAGAKVVINGIARTTDSAGKYFVSVVSSTVGYNLSISKNGFAPISVFTSSARRNSIHVLQNAFVQQISPTVDNTITSNTGVRVTIRANTLVDANGVAATGAVNVAIASYDPMRMPGDFTAVNSSGQQVALESVGAVSINATSSTGVPLNLRSGATADGFIPVPAQIGSMPPCVFDGSCRLAMWRFATSTGKWYEKQANIQFTAAGTSFTMMGGSSATASGGVNPLSPIQPNAGFGEWNADIERNNTACTIIEFVNVPSDCYHPTGTGQEPGIQLNVKLPNGASTFIPLTDRATLSLPFIVLYNIRANAVQEVGITFPAGAPAHCAGNLTIASTPGPTGPYPVVSATGGVTRFDSGAPWGSNGYPRDTGGNSIDFEDMALGNHPCNSTVQFQTSDNPVGPLKTAMTWSLLNSAVPNVSHTYALVGSDSITNPYQGDMLTSQTLPVLCINKNNPAYPGAGVIGSPIQTPGGAWHRTWSGATIALTTPVTGNSLTSWAVADALCASQLGAGYRMAEFHDGDPTLWTGWDFWAEVSGASITPFQNTRFWVAINDQNANPW